MDECLTFCSRFFSDDTETRFNKPYRNQDKAQKVSPGEFEFFSDGAKPLGKQKLVHFDDEFDQMLWYVLDNCDEARVYIE